MIKEILLKASLEDNSSYEESLEKRNRNLRRPESCWMNISAPPPSPSLSRGIPWQSSWKDGRPAMLPSCRNPSWNGCLICPWDCWILHTMLATYDALLFCLDKERRPHMSSALYWRSFLLPWSYPGHFLPQKGHLWPSFFFFFTLAVTMTEVTPYWFVSIHMFLKEAVLTNRRFLRDYSA